MPTLLWFRRDLRLGDHPALAAAAEDAPNSEVLACFVLDPRLEASSGRRRWQFLGDSLRRLRDDLDGRLLVTRGEPEHQIPRLAAEIDATSVHISEDFAPYGRRRDDQVRAALGSVPLVATGSPYLVSPGRVTKADGSPYRVFTPFMRQWREFGWRAPAASNAESARWLDPAGLQIAPCEIPDPGLTLDVAAGERAALAQWASFVDNALERYPEDRDRPGVNGTSRMSAYLKFGAIHPRTMVATLDEHNPGAQAYVRELAFRDFYADVLHHWPASLWRNWNSDFDAIETDSGAEATRRFESWKAGETGFSMVDAGMRQLRETGFMHNRVRMIVASFLVKDLHLPWQWGAQWFLDQLVDGDMASNQHGWQWVAGTGTDAAPYYRVFNPITQGLRFDPSGDYVRRYLPELGTLTGASAHEPWKLAGVVPFGYPERIVDHGVERTESLRRLRAN